MKAAGCLDEVPTSTARPASILNATGLSEQEIEKVRVFINFLPNNRIN